MPIRQLLAGLPESFGKLAPCVLMSPLSVAQYLPADQATFDVVIFDEASQITTWDAIGAIARGRQTIIVGDPKQLPPTNFFGRADDNDEDLPEVERDMPSILDEASASGVTSRNLDWHYRSRDEALIAFSNHYYYDDRLVTFPAPSTGSEAIKFHEVGGTYARGQGRVNQEEAKAVAEFVRQRLQTWLAIPEEKRFTLGVITFNAEQQSLILDLLDQIRREDSELEWFFADEREEPVIVKNLENIQGDERDVMLFSVTFGPDLAGKLTMNFGPINGTGGETTQCRGHPRPAGASCVLLDPGRANRPAPHASCRGQGSEDVSRLRGARPRRPSFAGGRFARPCRESLRGSRGKCAPYEGLGSSDPDRGIRFPRGSRYRAPGLRRRFSRRHRVRWGEVPLLGDGA